MTNLKNEPENNPPKDLELLRGRAQKLRLHGLLARWDEYVLQPWVPELIAMEEAEQAGRSRVSRIKLARIGPFKPFADFDWKHPQKIDRSLIEDLFSFTFLAESNNVVILGPNGVGKTMLAKNLAYNAVLRGHTARFLSSSDLLNDLASASGAALKLRFKRYVLPKLLVIDEVGYLNYDNRYADLFYQVVARRYDAGAPIVLTTNKPFSEWNQVFDSAACVVSLVDRLCHRCEIVEIHGASFRISEAQLRAQLRHCARNVSRPNLQP